MRLFFLKKKIIFFWLVVLFFSTTVSFAANPITPIVPGDNIQDPGALTTPWGGCGPSDSNCYVTTPPGGAASLSALTAATIANNINNGNFTQEWQWNSLSGSGLKITANTTAAAGNAQRLFEVALSGANATVGQITYSGTFSNLHTGAGTNIGLYATATGGANNYAAIFDAGNVGIGTTTPAYKVDVAFDSSAAGGEGLRVANANALGRSSAFFLNNNGLGGLFSAYGSLFPAVAYRNNFVVSADRSLIFLSDGNTDTGGASPIKFIAGGYNNSSSLYIAPGDTGNVGIGTDLPGHKLDVSGGVNADYGIYGSSLDIGNNGMYGSIGMLHVGPGGNTSASGGPVMGMFSNYGLTDVSLYDANGNQELYLYIEGSSGAGIGVNNSGIPFYVYSGAASMTLDPNTSGVGVGTLTPKAGFQVGTRTSLFTTNNLNTNIGNNVYFDGLVFKRIEADNDAPLLQLHSDGYVSFFSPSDVNATADSVITYTERVRFEKNGSVGIGDTTPDYLLDVQNTGADTNIFSLTDSDGECLYNPESGAVTVTCSSDERLKAAITDTGSALAYFRPFKVRDYTVIASGDKMVGVIAQEVLQIHPEIVTTGANGMYSVQLPNQWQLVKAIQELDIAVSSIQELKEGDNSFVAKIRLWLSDINNGINKIFAKKVETQELCLNKSDGTQLCVTAEALQKILEEVPPVASPVEQTQDQNIVSVPEQEVPLPVVEAEQP